MGGGGLAEEVLATRLDDCAWLVRIGTVVGLVLLGAACAAGGAATTTVDPDSGLPSEEAAAALGHHEQLELQARAMARAWSEWASEQTPVCARAEAPVELRAAIAEVFPVEVEYLDGPEPEPAPGGEYRCVLVVGPGPVVRLGPDVVGVEAGAVLAPLNGGGGMYQFRWDGSEWLDATREETGVTLTTWVT